MTRRNEKSSSKNVHRKFWSNKGALLLKGRVTGGGGERVERDVKYLDEKIHQFRKYQSFEP
jgi:hypothetical protein